MKTERERHVLPFSSGRNLRWQFSDPERGRKVTHSRTNHALNRGKNIPNWNFFLTVEGPISINRFYDTAFIRNVTRIHRIVPS